TAVRLLDDLLRGDVHATRVGVGKSLDVTLVVQPPVGLFRGDIPQVVEHLVPESRVQQVQHGVFHTADVEVQPARVVDAVQLRARAHPVPLVDRVAHGLGVVRIDVAQLVPA